MVDMLREDLDRARNAWLDTFQDAQARIEAEEGDFLQAIDSSGERIDFHALRHTTATWLIHEGADVVTIQRILRHSDIKLTLQRYGHLFPGAEASAVDLLGSSFRSLVSKAVANGSAMDSAEGASARKSMHFGAHLAANSENEKTPVSQAITLEKPGFSLMRAEGLEPSTQGLKVLCSTN